MDATPLTPARLWKTMSPAQRLAAVHAFWLEEQAADEQVQAVMLIAQQKKFRPKSVVSLDLDRKARHLASIVNLPEAIAARALISYHLAEQRPMMGAFLDALGIAHDNGLIQEDSPAPDTTRLAPAAAAIAGQYPAADVTLYLNTLLCQDPETWSGLAEIVAGMDTSSSAAAPPAPGA
jgi:hypothetical protein